MIREAVKRLLHSTPLETVPDTWEERIALGLLKKAESGAADAVRMLESMLGDAPEGTQVVVRVVKDGEGDVGAISNRP